MKKDLNFIGKSKIFFGISLAIIAIGIICNIIFGATLDIQFRGGTIVTYGFVGEIDQEALKDTIQSATPENQVSFTITQDIMNNTEDQQAYSVSIQFSGNESVSSEAVGTITDSLEEKFPENTWWLHFHNTRGLAMANIVAAMDVGMTQFDSSFGGLGGCPFVPNAAGNISTEDVLHMCEASGIETGVDLPKVMDLTRKMQEMLGKNTLESYVMKAGRNADLIAQMAE